MNTVVVSDDGFEATITNPGKYPGWSATIRSARPDGFAPEDLWAAQQYEPPSDGLPGQRTTTRRWKFGRWVVYAHLLTGPPTWILPMVSFKRPDGARRLLVGWLQAAVAVRVRRESNDT